MWLLALLLVGACAFDPEDDDDMYDRYSAEAAISSPPSFTESTQESYTTTPARTLSLDEIRQVKGVLSNIMANRDPKQPESVTDLEKLLDSISSTTDFSPILPDDPMNASRYERRHWYNFKDTNMTWRSDNGSRFRSDSLRAPYYKLPLTNQTHIITDGIIFRKTNRMRFDLYTREILEFPIGGYEYTKINTNFSFEETYCTRYCLYFPECKTALVDNYYTRCVLYRYHADHPDAYIYSDKYCAFYERIGPTTTTTDSTTEPTSTALVTLPRIIDIRKLVEIIANLTMGTIESNITDLFNATLQKYGIPMCGETTTTEEPTYDFANATIISKCFVCGLETPGIPHNAYCADAFAGDFLPLVPVDPRAKGQIARYRKYCRYLDVPGVIQNETQPRSVFGRFTGGCSVRWIDLSGVYTQRACRNRRHAVMGKHYVSKRMAKLEMALQNEDNGCVISPMSSLVPLSRGISLYARFHACVCTGSWCNGAHATLWHAGLISFINVALAASGKNFFWIAKGIV